MLQLLSLFITLCYLLLLARIILGFVVQYMTMQGNGAPEMLVRLYDVVFSLTEPVLGPIRRMLPQTGKGGDDSAGGGAIRASGAVSLGFNPVRR